MTPASVVSSTTRAGRRLGLHITITTIIALIIAAFSATSASAKITATTNEVHQGPRPASVALNQHEHADSGMGSGTFGAHAFDEEQSYVTKAPILLDVCTTNTSPFVVCANPKSGNIDRPTSLSAGTISAGTCIDSHMIHADPPGSTGPVRTYGTLTGNQRTEATFDSMILGVVLLSTK